jgi:hypothetical protein
MCLEKIPIRIDRIRNGLPWMPISIRIRQNDADPIRINNTAKNYKKIYRDNVRLFYILNKILRGSE